MTHTFGDTLSPSASYPAFIPTDYQDNEALIDAYQRGWNHGHGIACHNVPTIGETYWTEEEGRMLCDRENVREVHLSLCHAAERNSRCYSPFEFTAHEFNSAETDEDGNWNPDLEGTSADLWEAFEAGTHDAIAADLSTYTDEDYGIEDEDEQEAEVLTQAQERIKRLKERLFEIAMEIEDCGMDAGWPYKNEMEEIGSILHEQVEALEELLESDEH
jgi:hypothetical protein